MEERIFGICPSQKGKLDAVTREPQVSGELNNLTKRISELSDILISLEQKLTPILPNIGQEVASNSPQKEGSTLVPLAFSISQQARDVQRITQRIDYLLNTIEV